MNIQRVDFTSKTAPQDFLQSIHDTGFVVFNNHPIGQKIMADFYLAWEAFFKQSEEAKRFWTYSTTNLSGFIPSAVAETAKGAKVKDVKEFFNFYTWGLCPDELREMTIALRKQLLAIGIQLFAWIDEYTPKEIKDKFILPISKMMENTAFSLFRINYYPALKGGEEPGAFRAAAHEDIDLLTVLTAGTDDGLQAMDRSGHWHTVPAEIGNLVINVGDMLQEASGHYYPSTKHRVLMPAGEATKRSRMSCPLFVQPPYDIRLSEKYTVREYHHERHVELGLRKPGEY
jgi:isopenicillin N synthase-like dioxygenase